MSVEDTSDGVVPPCLRFSETSVFHLTDCQCTSSCPSSYLFCIVITLRFCLEFVRVGFGDYLQVSISRNEDEDPILRDSEAAKYIHILLSKDILDVDRMRGQ